MWLPWTDGDKECQTTLNNTRSSAEKTGQQCTGSFWEKMTGAEVEAIDMMVDEVVDMVSVVVAVDHFGKG